ncbi:tetratricopeptide repeat protein [Uliginosibacterium sp. H3]|uniref:protein O-GlcNAc transferase n=1 Tax=Uliginosibacterium silvisoli TaxID=3114758 RepID=A0ABU6K9U0_9RHOO|nr:tetratricopeptide repeat protein [Uliginosibacterium sp. H3]
MKQALVERAQALSRAAAWGDASKAWQEVIAASPQDPLAWKNLGLARAHAGQYPEAIDAFATGMQHGLPADEVATGTGIVFCLRQQYDVARDNLEMAVASNPQNLTAWSNLVVCYTRLGLVEQTFQAAGHVLAIDENNLSALGSLASLCKDMGLADEALAWARRAAEAAPDQPHLVSNLMWAMLHADSMTSEDLLEAGKEFNRRAQALVPANPLQSPLPSRREGGPSGLGEGKASSNASRPFPPSHLSPQRERQPQAAPRRIKIGWLSADLRNHAVGRFVIPVLEALDAQRSQSFIYNTGHLDDAWSERARQHATWREAANLSDTQLVALIRSDEIDILIDLSGHTDGSRLAALAQRAAPLQASWLGFPDTTGLSTIDHILVPPDPVLEAGNWCSETPLALPGCYCPREATTIDDTPRPPRDGKPFTFGSLNNLAKLSPTTLAVWATILQNEPDARLILVATAGDNLAVADDLRARFVAHGANPAQLDIRGRMDYEAYRACWREIDLGLDPFPFNGGTTGFDALCAGKPFVTLAGDSLHARMGRNLLVAVGLPELVAETVEDYIIKAVTLARAPADIAALHSRLPQQLRASPLMDVTGFARGLEALFEQLLITGRPADHRHAPDNQ